MATPRHNPIGTQFGDVHQLFRLIHPPLVKAVTSFRLFLAGHSTEGNLPEGTSRSRCASQFSDHYHKPGIRYQNIIESQAKENRVYSQYLTAHA